MITSSSLRRTAKVAALTVAVTASGSAVALAGTGGSTTSGNNGILGGNQISAPISIPLNVCGNALALLGDAFGGCQGGAWVRGGEGGSHWTTSGDNSILGGNQIKVPISAPVNVCGNSAAVLGTSASGCKGGAKAAAISSHGGSHTTTSGKNSIGGGNQISVPVKVPINICGNSVAILGLAASGCKGGSGTGTPPPRHHHQPPSHWRLGTIPPPRHHQGPPPSHHGGSQSGSGIGSGSLPTTGANFLGLLALAGSVLTGGAGCVLVAARRGLIQGVLASTRRAARSLTAGAR